MSKNLSSAIENICDDKKPALSALVAVTDKKGIEDKADEFRGTALIQHEPIHYHILPPNEPHPCDKYGCPREAKYKLGDDYYCDDKAISHFREVANTCREAGFKLIEDMQQLDI